MLCLLIGEAPVATGDGVTDLILLDLSLGIHFHHHRVGEFILIGTQRADVVAQFLGQHGHRAVYQIDRCGALIGLLVDDRARGDIVAHVGDMDTDFPVAVLQLLDGQGVVKVLGVGRVDGERGHVTHVAALGDFLRSDAVIQGLGGLGDILGILVGKSEFSQDGMDLGIVLAGNTQHVNHLADGRVGILWPFDNLDYHLVSGAAAGQLVQRDEDVGGQELAVGGQLGKVLEYLQRADKHLLLALQNLHDFGLRLHAGASGTDVDQHAVAVQGVHRVALGNHDGLAVVGGGVHTVLAVAAADEDALGHLRAIGCLVAADTHLNKEAVNSQLLQYVDDEGPAPGRIGAHGCRHLLVVERFLALLIKEIDDPVVIFTTLLPQ